ncbi:MULTISPECIES: hypothetical protein [Pseudomonas aeruginosa group]|nr:MULTISPECIES: hypothetical protein [Pseudomonas aeruginosa group]MCW8021699.1 hypothetical protein [Pseudomonas aeruginosa]
MPRSYERRDLTLATIPAENPETYAMISRSDTSQLAAQEVEWRRS